MKIDIKNKWLEALRSGEYRKSVEVLKRHYSTKPGHCCLGVLCEVIKDDYPPAARLIAPKEYGPTGIAPISNAAMLDPKAREYVDMPHDVMTRLATLNDNGASFSRIAHYIEKHL